MMGGGERGEVMREVRRGDERREKRREEES